MRKGVGKLDYQIIKSVCLKVLIVMSCIDLHCARVVMVMRSCDFLPSLHILARSCGLVLVCNSSEMIVVKNF